TLYGVVIAAGLNSVLSLFYYAKVLKVMALERNLEEVENRPVQQLPLPAIHSIFLSAVALALLVIFVFWDPLVQASSVQGINGFTQPPAARPPAGADAAKGAQP